MTTMQLSRCLLAGMLLTLGDPSTGSADSGTGHATGAAGGPLDGMTFAGKLGPSGQPRDTRDRFVFENGNFVSKECELRCGYPASPYYVRDLGQRIEFISETRCPYKDARIVWRGTVEGDTIRGKSTWVVKRWYWTIEDSFEFEGRRVPAPSSAQTID